MLIYDLIYFILMILSIPLWIKVLFKKQYRAIILSRLNPQFKQSRGPSIWVHAVSVGEVRSLEMFLSRLKKHNASIYLSVTTPSGFKYAKEKYDFIQVINAPLDFSFVIKRFIKRIQPEILILNELEIWPNWIHLLKKNKIKTILINGRISEKAFKMYSVFRGILSPIFKKIDLFIIQSDYYKEKFKLLHIPDNKIVVCGNIKADQAETYLNRVKNPQTVYTKLKIIPPQKKIIVAASTHPDDEQILFPVLPDILEKYALILVPRHPERSAVIREELNRNGLGCRIWSSNQPVHLDRDILIFDEIGFLFSILSIADVVIMGGTYKKDIGGHNFYEPLALKKTVFGGPHYNNFPDIGDELSKEGLYVIANNSAELSRFLLDYTTTPDQAAKFRNIFEKRKGTVACTINEIEKILS